MTCPTPPAASAAAAAAAKPIGQHVRERAADTVSEIRDAYSVVISEPMTAVPSAATSRVTSFIADATPAFSSAPSPYVPMIMFAILFGLAMDYHVFLLSRVREEIDAGKSARRAVVDGLAGTGTGRDAPDGLTQLVAPAVARPRPARHRDRRSRGMTTSRWIASATSVITPMRADRQRRKLWCMLITGSLTAYLDEVGRYPRLSATDELRLGTRSVRGDRDAPRRLVEGNLRLLVSNARRYAGNGLESLDLIQEGNVGLPAAAERFDPRRGTRLASYAGIWIRQAICRSLSTQSRLVRVPLRLAESADLVYDRLAQELGSSRERARRLQETSLHRLAGHSELATLRAA